MTKLDRADYAINLRDPLLANRVLQKLLKRLEERGNWSGRQFTLSEKQERLIRIHCGGEAWATHWNDATADKADLAFLTWHVDALNRKAHVLSIEHREGRFRINGNLNVDAIKRVGLCCRVIDLAGERECDASKSD